MITYVLIAVVALVVLGLATRVVRARRRPAAPLPVAPLPEVLVEAPVERPNLDTLEPATLSGRLSASRGVFDRIRSSGIRGSLTNDQIELVEEVLLRSDVGVATTTAILEKLRSEGAPEGLVATLGAGDVQAALRDQGAVPVGSTPAQFRQFVNDEVAKSDRIVSEAGIQVE